MSEWTNWEDINRINELRENYCWPGVYKIRIADVDCNPFQIDRFLGSDSEGIVVIGNSINVFNRVRNFLKAYEGKYHKHSAGSRAFLLRAFLGMGKTNFTRNIYRDGRLMFTAVKLNSKPEAILEEEELLKVYFLTYGELPPLNRALPDDKVEWLKLEHPSSKSPH
ncbi:hypothetical protein ACFLW0_02450 [Chloroflexota bacterium]